MKTTTERPRFQFRRGNETREFNFQERFILSQMSLSSRETVVDFQGNTSMNATRFHDLFVNPGITLFGYDTMAKKGRDMFGRKPAFSVPNMKILRVDLFHHMFRKADDTVDSRDLRKYPDEISPEEVQLRLDHIIHMIQSPRCIFATVAGTEVTMHIAPEPMEWMSHMPFNMGTNSKAMKRAQAISAPYLKAISLNPECLALQVI